MDSLFHLVFAFIAGMAVNVKLKHRTAWVALTALSAVAIDIDHVLFTYQYTFHNLFITILLPAILFYLAYNYEKGKEQIKYQSLSLLLMVMLTGHLIADMFSGGVRQILYPVSTTSFSIPTSWNLTILQDRFIASPDGFALLIYALIISLAYYAEEFIYFFEKKHEQVEEALKDALTS